MSAAFLAPAGPCPLLTRNLDPSPPPFNEHGQQGHGLGQGRAALDAQFRSDLIAEASARLPDLQASMRARKAGVIEKILHSAADLDLDLTATSIPARDIAVVLLDALTGIAQQDEPAEELRRRLRQLVDLTVSGLARRPQ